MGNCLIRGGSLYQPRQNLPVASGNHKSKPRRSQSIARCQWQIKGCQQQVLYLMSSHPEPKWHQVQINIITITISIYTWVFWCYMPLFHEGWGHFEMTILSLKLHVMIYLTLAIHWGCKGDSAVHTTAAPRQADVQGPTACQQHRGRMDTALPPLPGTSHCCQESSGNPALHLVASLVFPPIYLYIFFQRTLQ